MQDREILPENTLSGRDSLFEAARPQSKIDYLIRIGLGHDKSKLTLYRRVLSDPYVGVTTQTLRPLAAEILDNLLDILFTDPQVWNRVKTILLRKKSQNVEGLTENLSEGAVRSLLKKSIEHEVPLEVLFQVYSRGAQLDKWEDQTEEQAGFARVNSFIAGGEARRLDADLLGEVSHFAHEPKENNTLSVVKRVLRESRGRN